MNPIRTWNYSTKFILIWFCLIVHYFIANVNASGAFILEDDVGTDNDTDTLTALNKTKQSGNQNTHSPLPNSSPTTKRASTTTQYITSSTLKPEILRDSAREEPVENNFAEQDTPSYIPSKFDYDDPTNANTQPRPRHKKIEAPYNFNTDIDYVENENEVHTSTEWSSQDIALYAGCSTAALTGLLFLIYVVAKTCSICTGRPQNVECCLCDLFYYGISAFFLTIWNFFKDCGTWLCLASPGGVSRRGYKGMLSSESTQDLMIETIEAYGPV